MFQLISFWGEAVPEELPREKDALKSQELPAAGVSSSLLQREHQRDNQSHNREPQPSGNRETEPQGMLSKISHFGGN